MHSPGDPVQICNGWLQCKSGQQVHPTHFVGSSHIPCPSHQSQASNVTNLLVLSRPPDKLCALLPCAACYKPAQSVSSSLVSCTAGISGSQLSPPGRSCSVTCPNSASSNPTVATCTTLGGWRVDNACPAGGWPHCPCCDELCAHCFAPMAGIDIADCFWLHQEHNCRGTDGDEAIRCGSC